MAKSLSKTASATTALADVFKAFDIADVRDEFEHGAGPSFAVLSIRGGKFRIRQGGEDTLITNNEGDPVSSVNIVMVRGNSNFSKAYYSKAYEEGDDDTPTCYSMDGVKPEADAPEKQSKLCANCPKNMRGSRVTEAGKKLKACSDVRRVAVVPYPDMENEDFGGPMLLRVPAASLRPLAEFSKKLSSLGVPPFAIATKLKFDTEVSYPKLKFEPAAMLDEEQAKLVIELRESEKVQAILSTLVEADANAEDEDEEEEEPQAAGGDEQEEEEEDGGLGEEFASMKEPEKKKPAKKQEAKANGKQAKKQEAEPGIPDQETPEQERDREANEEGLNASTTAALDDLLSGFGV